MDGSSISRNFQRKIGLPVFYKIIQTLKYPKEFQNENNQWNMLVRIFYLYAHLRPDLLTKTLMMLDLQKKVNLHDVCDLITVLTNVDADNKDHTFGACAWLLSAYLNKCKVATQQEIYG